MNATKYEPLHTEQANLLSFLYAKFGNRTKALIYSAWMTGDYSALGLQGSAESQLQYLRNTHGPSWLHVLRWKSIA